MRLASCGNEEHTHSEECYETRLLCGKEESEGHTHTDACYETELVLVCGLEESEPILDEEGEVIEVGHVHTAECYEEVQKLVCGLEETEAHVHTDECYETVLVCGKTEHVHTKQCYSNPNAVESRASWEATIPEFDDEMSMVERVLAVAESQLGYKESTENYEVREDGSTKGYSRYGDWYGSDYGDWCAMFASFCLHYAGVEEKVVPYQAGCQRWIEELTDRGMYTSSKEYSPRPGDIIFFDNQHEGVSHHVGLVYEVNKDANQVLTIEGNTSNKVAKRRMRWMIIGSSDTVCCLRS